MSDIELEFFGSREALVLDSLRGRPAVPKVGDVVFMGTWYNVARLEPTTDTGFPVPLPIVAAGSFDFRYKADPSLLYERSAGAEALVAADLGSAHGALASLSPKDKATIRAVRVSTSDAPFSFEGFSSLRLVWISSGPEETRVSGLQRWLASLPASVEYLLIADASNADLGQIPPRLSYLAVRLTEGAEETFSSVPSLASLRWLYIERYRVAKNHGILGLDEGLFGDDTPAEGKADSEVEQQEATASALVDGLGRFPGLRNLRLEVREDLDLSFVSELPRLVRLEIQSARQVNLSALADHPALEELELTSLESWRAPSEPNTTLRRVEVDIFGGQAAPDLGKYFPEAVTIGSSRDAFRQAAACSDEWFIRPPRSVPVPEHHPPGLRVPPSAILRDPERLREASSKLRLGPYAWVKHFSAGRYPMVDLYRGGRLLAALSIDRCNLVYFVGEGSYELSMSAAIELNRIFAEANIPLPCDLTDD